MKRAALMTATAATWVACLAFLTAAAFRPDLVAARLMEVLP